MTMRAHEWEATGVTGYPITHPIVGQTDFYTKLKNYLQLVGTETNRFAHVFAVVAPWGVGKSRLGYEIVAQVNGTSRGWKVRTPGGGLEDARLFDSDEERAKYLALYIRYSQVANPALNLDNWFAPAVYKALAPLARGVFDGSIQHQIAKQSFARLIAEGFDPSRLAAALELDQHPEEQIYSDTALATRLCNAGYGVLHAVGICYVAVVLDELETAAERATAGMEAEEARTMDGKAITMLRRAVETLGRKDIETVSKAVKEEDARARFPWLRFVVLCSPAIGDELKEVQSTDRRFEIVDLERNAFSDVSAFVRTLEADGRLLRPYPKGLVEAAYMMSGGNFGWFNVTMAVVDQVLRQPSAPSRIDAIFRRAIDIANRIGSYVLDHRALDELPGDADLREAASTLLFGQEPVRSAGFPRASDLLAARNAHGEPIAIRFHQVEWESSECARMLIQARFTRLSGTPRWLAPGIAEPLDLDRLLDDLATLAIHEPPAATAGTHRLLVPSTLSDFLQLLDLVHPHPAAEETGRVLWNALIGGAAVPDADASHIGPSVEMLRRLDIRLRKASVGAVFRDPEENNAYSSVVDRSRPTEGERALQVLTGAVRLLDEQWSYDAERVGFGDGGIAIRTPKDRGLVDFKGLWLHPKGMAVFAWVAGDAQLDALAKSVAAHQRSEGRYPVVAFTNDYDLPERFARSRQPTWVRARETMIVVHLNSGEESALLSIGSATSQWTGFRLRRDGFTTRFGERLNRVKNPIIRQIRDWRHAASRAGTIAWPLKPNGTLKDDGYKRLVDGWRRVMLQKGSVALKDAGDVKGVDFPGLLAELDKLGLSPAAASKGFTRDDMAGLWLGEGADAQPDVPPFLLRAVVLRLLDVAMGPLDLEAARREWLWGYTWESNKLQDIHREWMVLACDLGWARPHPDAGRKKKGEYELVSRAELRGALDAARTWLDDRYPAIFTAIGGVLGPGVLDVHFKPGAGSKYARARQDLLDAADALRNLDALEANRPPESAPDAQRAWLIEATRSRLRVRDLVAGVFDREKYEALPPDRSAQTLALLDETRPLWERIRHAEHFAADVRLVSGRIRKRVPQLIEGLKEADGDLRAFPFNLFVRPLLKIEHIVDAGMSGENPEATTERQQHLKVNTLAWYLKELRVADAHGALDALAREVGVGAQVSDDLPIDAIDGEILRGYRDLRERYATARRATLDLDARASAIDTALRDAPADFRLPAGVALDMVVGTAGLIEAQLNESVEDDVEDLLDRHDDEMNLGMFAPIMREARARLLDVPEQAIKGLEGRVRTIENAIQSYRKALLADSRLLRARSALNALRRARHESEIVEPTLESIENLPLGEGARVLAACAEGWATEGERILAGAGVPFSTWQDVAAALGERRAPALDDAQAEALVRHGFLRRVYALAEGDS